MTRITGALHEDQCTFMVISCSGLLTVRNISDKSSRENQNTHFMSNNFPPSTRKSSRLRVKVEKCGRERQVKDGNIIQRLRFAFWIDKSYGRIHTHTHSEYVTVIAVALYQ